MNRLHLEAWRDFYVMIGTASGVIVGATFIVATLAGNMEKRALGLKGFITPTAVHLGSVLIGSAILTVPTLTSIFLAALLGIGGAAGFIYSLVVWVRISALNLDIPDRLWYAVLPVLSYALLAVAAGLAFLNMAPCLELLAAALVSLLIVGMHNAWDMATFMVLRGGNDADRP